MKRHEKQRRRSSWLGLSRGFGRTGRPIPVGRTMRMEPLERRELLAADLLLSLLGSSQTTGYLPPDGASTGQDTQSFQWSEIVGEGESTPEAEAADDLVAFAKALAASGTKFYGAAWCIFCTEQKQLFEDGGKYLPFIEVTNPDRTPNQVAIDNNITSYPTWVFPDNTRLEGVQDLETLSQRSGVAIPQSANPFISELANVSVGIGSPLHVPIDAYHPAGLPLTISVSSDNPSLIGASMVTGNRSLRISTNYGDMVFVLFEDKAPRPSGRVIELAESGFYDDLIFHRVINNFMIQGGDPTGTGAGGSPLGNFDDQFHLDLQHNRSGVLSFAKSGDDTNNSQFFITAGPTRHLDFNHSVFGQLVEGDAVRHAISQTATNASDRPINEVRMNEVTVFEDDVNGLVLLKPTGSGTGSANITVTVSDDLGNTTSRTFVATVGQDTANGGPFLNDIPVLQMTSGTTLSYTLTSQDKEGDSVIYSVEPLGAVQYQLSVNSQTGVVSLTPPSNFVGQLQFLARVRQATATTTQDVFDSQVVTVQVSAATVLNIALSPSSDSGLSNSDGVTNATSLVFTVSGTTPGATIEVLSGGQVVGLATASSSTTQVTVPNAAALNEGTVLFSARQKVNDQIVATSASLAVTLDRTSPTALAVGAVPANAFVNVPLAVNLNHPEEGQGLRYSLQGAPSGMTVGELDGILNWTPSQAQLGAQSFTLLLTDLAGNQRQQTFHLNVAQQPALGYRLATVSTVGTALNTVQVGQQFVVQVYVEDLRQLDQRDGVFSAFLDLLFDSAIVQPITNSPIQHFEPYSAGVGGTVTDGAITGLGGVATSIVPLGASERLLAEVTFTALAPEILVCTRHLSVDDTALYNRNNAVGADEIQFGSSAFVVGLDFQLTNDVFNFDEDTGPHSLNVLANDTAASGVVLTIVEVGEPSGGGSVSIASGGQSLSYTPAANFHGAETFTYTVANAQGLRQTATVTVQVTEVNDPPEAVNDFFNVVQNSSNNVLDVLANDHQGADEGVFELLTVIAVTQGSAGGSVQIGSSGLNVRYTPPVGFSGIETFNYTLSDGRGGTDVATVTVTVGPAVPPPIVGDDSFTLLEDSPQASYDVLANDSPATAGDTLSIRSVGASQVGSTVSVSANGLFLLYQPAANFAGQEVITYTVEASDGGIAVGRVTFTVTNVDDPPTAVDDTLSVLSPSGPSVLNVLANDFDVDPGDSFTITAVTQPPAGSGSVAISADGLTLIYTPPSTNFEGSFSFSYTITDTTGLSDAATVNLTVLNYTPRSFSGKVFYAQTDGQSAIGQFALHLSGNALGGGAVNTSVTVGPDGSFSFNNLAPGEYQLSRPALPLLNDTGEVRAISSGPADGNLTINFVVNSGLHASHVDVRDFLGSTFGRSLTAVVDSSGATSWLAPTGDWASLTTIQLQLNSTALAIQAVNGAQQNLSATVPLTHSLLSLTSDNGYQLIRLRGGTSKFGLTATAASSALTEQAEGEAIFAQNMGLGGEGEPEGWDLPQVAGSPVEDGWVPRMSGLQLLLGANQSALAISGPLSLEPAAVDEVLSGPLDEIDLALVEDWDAVWPNI